MSQLSQQHDPGEISSGTPLRALSAVCLDTETTGLDTKRDRLIQVGGVRIHRGEIVTADALDALVNPAQPIPESSTRIHGLTDEMVRDAPQFSQYHQTLEAWIGNAVLLGYSIGFDLAILEREYALADLEWSRPRTLDVRHMVRILSPQLPDYSLDTVASWLKIESRDRHNALGDAIMTARVFTALVPMLREQGVRTVAEIERLCRDLDAEGISEAAAGWVDFLRSDSREDQSHLAFARIDSYPYRHRVRDVMSSDPVYVAPDADVSAALSVMMERQISSVLVAGDNGQTGILTERDVLRLIDLHREKALALPVVEHANFPLLSIAEGAFLYRAMGRMTRNSIRHLGVVDRHGRVTGMVTSRNLLRQRSEDAVNLGDAIDHAEKREDLGIIWANIAMVARALDYEEVDARDTAAVISRELRALTRRSCEIAEREMASEGKGGPPVPYAMMVLGSGGRGESLLAMDQDNAIVYADGDDNAANDAWFADLGTRVSGYLDDAGVPYCKGGIMGMNAEWRMPLSAWKESVQTWVTRTSPEDILKTDIFYDATCVHGDYGLMRELTDYALEVGAAEKQYLHLLSVNAADVKSPLGLFGRFQLTDGRMDVKMGGILPIFSAARVQAIRHRIAVRSTPGRLESVRDLVDCRENLVENLIEAHRIILSAILSQQIHDLDHGITLSNRIAPDLLPAADRASLKWALEQVRSVTDLLGVPA